MKRNIFAELKNDLWVVVMDVIGINASYILALLLRYYVHNEFKSSALKFIDVYLQFAPWYTILCILVFALFRLYNGVWRYAGVNDMNRIIGATAVTAVINFLGTTIFVQRLPISYYVVGTALQFFFTSVIRFSYRFLVFKKRNVAEAVNPGLPVIVVGGNEKVIGSLERESKYHPIAIVDYNMRGKSVHGLPVMESAEEALDAYKVRNVVLADPNMADRDLEKLKKACEQHGAELHEYSWSRRLSKVSVVELAGIVQEPYRVKYKDEEYKNLEAAMESLDGRYSVTKISGDGLVVEIEKTG